MRVCVRQTQVGVCVFYWLLSTVHSIRAQQLNHNTTPVLPTEQRRFVLSVNTLKRRRLKLGTAHNHSSSGVVLFITQTFSRTMAATAVASRRVS